MATLLKNCRIYDGTGSDAVNGSVLFEGDRIIEVGDVDESRADRVIDLEGRSLASGFIDPHSHNDWFAIKTEPLKYFEPFIRQGIFLSIAALNSFIEPYFPVVPLKKKRPPPILSL